MIFQGCSSPRQSLKLNRARQQVRLGAGRPDGVVGVSAANHRSKATESFWPVLHQRLGNYALRVYFRFFEAIRRQKTKHDEHISTCKRCFASFDDWLKMKKLRSREALEQHITSPSCPWCWPRASRSPLTRRRKCSDCRLSSTLILRSCWWKRGGTRTMHTDRPMSYAVKASNNVPVELLVAFVTSMAWKISDSLRNTKVTIRMTVDDIRRNETKAECDLCHAAFTDSNPKVVDHCRLSGWFRRT